MFFSDYLAIMAGLHQDLRGETLSWLLSLQVLMTFWLNLEFPEVKMFPEFQRAPPLCCCISFFQNEGTQQNESFQIQTPQYIYFGKTSCKPSSPFSISTWFSMHSQGTYAWVIGWSCSLWIQQWMLVNDSREMQKKPAGPITQRSMDWNHPLLKVNVFHYWARETCVHSLNNNIQFQQVYSFLDVSIQCFGWNPHCCYKTTMSHRLTLTTHYKLFGRMPRQAVVSAISAISSKDI